MSNFWKTSSIHFLTSKLFPLQKLLINTRLFIILSLIHDVPMYNETIFFTCNLKFSRKHTKYSFEKHNILVEALKNTLLVTQSFSSVYFHKHIYLKRWWKLAQACTTYVSTLQPQLKPHDTHRCTKGLISNVTSVLIKHVISMYGCIWVFQCAAKFRITRHVVFQQLFNIFLASCGNYSQLYNPFMFIMSCDWNCNFIFCQFYNTWNFYIRY